MKHVLKWYLSGFYKKPKGLKKPYNPILGEVFRCQWENPKTNSKTFYIAEQVLLFRYCIPISFSFLFRLSEIFISKARSIGQHTY